MEPKTYLALAPEMLADVDPNSSYAVIRTLVGAGQHVLDVGCGPGNLARILHQAGNTVVGIDADQHSLRAAQNGCERTISADLDVVNLADAVGEERFDVIVFADVLEHLRNPARLLAASKRVLRERGTIVVSIPNVAHGAVRLALLRGRFDYRQLGILDDTHLRFYTRESIEQLLTESGFIPTVVERTTAPIFEKSDLVPYVRREDFDGAVVDEIMADSEAATLQFVVCATPVDDAAVLAALRAKLAEHGQVIRTLRARLAQVERERAMAAELRDERDLATAENAALRTDLDAARASAEQLRESRDGTLAELTETSAARDEARKAADAAAAALALVAAARESALNQVDAARAEVEAARAEVEVARREAEAARAEVEAARREAEAARAEVAAARGEAEAARAEAAASAGEAADDRANEAQRYEEALREAESQRRELLRKLRSGDESLAIERATRRDVADAFDLVGRIALRDARSELADELARLLARSEADDARLDAMRSAAHDRARASTPPPARVASRDLCARLTARRTVVILAPENHVVPRSRWHRLRGLMKAAFRRSLPTDA